MATGREYWERVYEGKAPEEVSWFQPRLTVSLDLIGRCRLDPSRPVVDIGGGASTLVDHLLAGGFQDITVLDLSQTALDRARVRLGEDAGKVEWMQADVTEWRPARRYDLWHDRAVLHFLTGEEGRHAYRRALLEATRAGGFAVIATFAEDGPEKCSGLSVRRYSPAQLAAFLGEDFRLIESRREEHVTPGGVAQRFQYSLLQREE